MQTRAALLSLLALLLLLLSPAVALAGKKPTCADPHDAVDAVWRWQEKDSVRLDYAAACFETTGRSPKQRQELARRLAIVYDHEPALIDMDRLQAMKPDYVDPDTGEAKVIPHQERFPKVYLERKGVRWLWTKESLDWIDRYYVENLSGMDQLIERIPSWLKGEIWGVAYWQYLAIALLLAVGLLVREVLRAVVAARVRRVSEKLGQRWAIKLVDVIAGPGATLVVAVVLRISYPQLRLPLNAALAMQVAVQVLLIISLIWAVYRGTDVLSARLEAKAQKTQSKLDDQLIPLMRKTLKVFIFIAGVLFVLQNLHVDVGSLLAGLGLGGLAFALAAKDTLANLFGSIMIFVDSPFQIGDWINVGGAEGTVEEVGFRSTRIRTFYDSVIVYPNSKLANTQLDNYQRREYRRCFVTLGLTYDTTPEQMQAFVEGLRAIVRANPTTRKDKYEIHMSGFGDSSLNVMLYFFFKVPTWSEELRQRHNVFLEVMRLAEDLGVSFAFPTQSLHLEQVAAPGAPRDLAASPPPKELGMVVDSYGPGGGRARPGGPEISEGYLPLPAKRGSEDDGDGDAG
ncbi:MAG: mechanosensitive ion channel family protein [Deltaproteobacteria bacterium]|jgi:MscS family membrane protein|nr:mechanosensitive ion channel family protein [Deltaproteobacteria bacterium]MBW2534202.1 mechanosensitive ion channel family protein [Deltaproteobacteria bacterium]